MSKVLAVQNLAKTFKVSALAKRQILNDVSFSIDSGTTVGFVGANGSGKTTTIKTILNFIFPDRGEVFFFENQKLNDQIKSRIGFLPERPYLPDFMTVKEFLNFHWQLSGGGNGFVEKAQKILKRVNLENVDDRPLRAFSKGMQQRAALAQTLLREPDLIILDEPMTGLDPDGRLIVKEIIRTEHQRGSTIFFSSHLLADMDELCSHIVMMEKGKIRYSGSIQDFYGQAEKKYLVSYRENGKLVDIEIDQANLNEKLKDLIFKNVEVVRLEKAHQSVETVYAKMRKEQ